MILRRISLATKLEKLKEHTKAIKKLQKTIDQKRFLSDEIIQKAIERHLQLALEAVLDIADQIISEYELSRAETYRENIYNLGEAGVLPRKFAEKFAHAAGFRNILVHDYIDLDLKKVYEHFKKDAQDIEQFIKYVGQFMQKQR